MPQSKLDKELSTALETGKGAVTLVKDNIQMHAPVWFVEPIKRLLLDERLIPFMLGMGVEAAGIAIQDVIGVAAYPVLDVVTVGVVVIVLAWYQRKRRVQHTTN